jgi:hypothetical protein
MFEHPGDPSFSVIPVNEGVAKWNHTLVLDRSYQRWTDKEADVKFRIKWRGRKLAKIHLNLEQLRRDLDDANGVSAKSAHIGGIGGLFITMDFVLEYSVISDQGE